MSRIGALKVLDHALSSEAGKENCAKFVEILALRTIFPLFMKTPKKTKRKGMSAEEFEGAFIYNLGFLDDFCDSMVTCWTFWASERSIDGPHQKSEKNNFRNSLRILSFYLCYSFTSSKSHAI